MPPPPKTTKSKGANSGRKKPAADSNSAQKPEPTATLGVSDLRQRLIGLEEANAQLLKLISRKRKEVDKLTNLAQEIQQRVRQAASPIVLEMQQLDAEIHQIFRQIFATRKMGKQTARMVQDVYMMLQVTNFITFSPDNLEDLDDLGLETPDEEGPEDFRGFGRQQPTESHARQSDREETRQLRQVFLRLATVFHPDKVSDAVQSEEYAEVMKEVNLAYQRGDLARLLAIEQQYQLGTTIDRTNADDLTLRCQQLERENQLLLEQKLALQSELRQLKSNSGMGLGEYQKLQKMGVQPIDSIIAQAQDELSSVRELRDFVQSFLERRITVAEFQRGPQPAMSPEDLLQDPEIFLNIFR